MVYRRLFILVALYLPIIAFAQIERRLYVAEDHGFIYVYDINDHHRLLRRFEVPGTGSYKGVSADPRRGKLYLSSYVGDQFVCVDLKTEKVDWSIPINGYPDSHAMTPDGKFIYLPKRHARGWDVIDADLKQVVDFIPIPYGNPHNTWCNKDGTRMYLSALGNENLYVVDTRTQKITKTIGPFQPDPGEGWGWIDNTINGPKGIRPFAVTEDDRYCYVNVDGILGYEIGEIETGKRLGRVEITGFEKIRGNHLTTSHGINITPDQKEIWVSNDAGPYIHVFDRHTTPHKQIANIKLNRRNGWISFSIDGQYVYPSCGDVIDARTKKIIAQVVESEKLVEVQFEAGQPIHAGTR